MQQTDLYEQSTQFKDWTFTKTELSALRSQCNTRAIEAVRKYVRDEACMSVGEEYALVLFYSLQIEELARQLQFPSYVKAPAVAYFKRFYLLRSTMDYHPRDIMLTCLFLATKTENHFTPIDQFTSRIPNSNPETILELEFTVSEAIDFKFTVHHPYRALHGFYLDLQKAFESASAERLGGYHDEARKLVASSILGDATFLFAPSQIALSALLSVNRELICSFLKIRMPANAPAVLSLLDNITPYLRPDIPSAEEAVKVEEKLSCCQNPEHVPGSNEYGKRNEHRVTAERERRQKKIQEENRKRNQDTGVFGKSISNHPT